MAYDPGALRLDLAAESWQRWIRIQKRPASRLLPKILHLPCGNGREYGCFKKYGFTRAFRYQGRDTDALTVLDAASSFRGVDFQYGNPFTLDSIVDYVVATNVMEQLSINVMALALSRIIAVARQLVILNFVNMDDRQNHTIRLSRSLGRYSNVLSRTTMIRMIEDTGSRVIHEFEADKVPIAWDGGMQLPYYRRMVTLVIDPMNTRA